MAHEVPGIDDAFDRSPSRPGTDAVVFREGPKYFAQAADINEGFSIARNRAKRISDRSIKDGDRQEGADINVDVEAETVHVFAGQIYIGGDIYPVPEAFLVGVPMVGESTVGVRVVRTVITEEDDPSLNGLMPGSRAEGEPGAARTQIDLQWGYSGDGEEGELYSVYRLLDGTVITQAPPPALSGVLEVLAPYDFDVNGHYIVDGCEVTAIGLAGTDRVFSIAAGTANIRGFKRIREAAFTIRQTEDPALEPISGETHLFTGPTGGSTTLTVNRGPVAALQVAIVTKRATAENVIRGNVAGGIDPLAMAGAFEIESISQGGVPIDPEAYTLVGNNVSWGPAGTEPIAASTYQVTYLYNVSVLDTATFTDTTVTVLGGVNGRNIIISYTSKLPRRDLICLDIGGRPVYVKGISARRGALPPPTPANLLKLAEVSNDWLTAPVVTNNGTRNVTQDEHQKLRALVFKLVEQFDRFTLQNDVRVPGTPTSRRGIFTDTFIDDFYRDPGATQTAAINRGVLQLAIDAVLQDVVLGDVITLPYTEEIIVSQPQRTTMSLINPWDNYTPFPAGMKITPAAYFWTEFAVEWTSPVTQEFTAAPDQPPGTVTYDEQAGTRDGGAAEFLPEIDVEVVLSGFGVNEELATLTFDDVDVKPAGTQTADANGEIALTFAIPPNVPAGRRLVRATGEADSFAETIFVGQGQVDVAIMRRVTLVAHAAPVPVVINNTIIQNTINQINQIANPNWTSERGSTDTQGSIAGTDPLAQSFRPPTPRFVIGVNFWLEQIGLPQNGLRVQLVTIVNGQPSTDILAECFVSMQGRTVGEKVQARFDAPVFLDPLRLYAWVWLTSDPDHAISSSRLGDVVGTGPDQERVSAQPYTIGDKFTSSNRVSWLVHPDEDVAFETVGVSFTSTTSTVNLWTGTLDNISDLLVRGAIEIPTEDVRFRYEIVRADASVIPLTAGQTHEFNSYVSETVTLRAVLTGTETLTPVLYPGTFIAGGRIRATGTYVSRLFQMGVAVDIAALFAAFIPAGAEVTVDVDAGDNVWVPLTLDDTFLLGDGWVEPKYDTSGYSASEGRLRVTLEGGPDKRVSIAALRGYSV